ncbi:MAG: hypothetical protein GX774_12175 [Armatimonadetes bacterium]|nr:hypothetical protein [Armatimonadota bacterium]
MTVREEVHQLVDQLTDAEVLMLQRLLRGITLAGEGRVPRSPATEEERLALIEEACAVLTQVPDSAAEAPPCPPTDP